MRYSVVSAFCLLLLSAFGVSAQPASSDNTSTLAADSQPAISPDNAPDADKTPGALSPDKPFDAPPNGLSQLSMEQPQVGDHWTIETRDSMTGAPKATVTATITTITATEIGIRVDVLGKPDSRSEIYDRSWNMRSTSGKNSILDGTGVKLPLKVGDSWDVPAYHGLLNATGSSKVLAQETIATRAGSFDAFKIDTKIHAYFDKIKTKNIDLTQTKAVDLMITAWYAPSIDHWVKRTVKLLSDGALVREVSSEVVAYGRR
jgi:hypothetical protein